jgi:hypothetical protein
LGASGFAVGGIATSATPGVFGEAGPEALIPLDRLSNISKNASVQLHYSPSISFPAEASPNTVSMFRGMLRDHSRELVAMLDEYSRDGDLAE